MLNETQDTCAQTPRAEMVARLNDALRTTGQYGSIMVTRGVRQLVGYGVGEVLEALSSYNAFDMDNDPHGERDFGDLRLFGADLLWKIDYYDLALQFGSEDPADAARTRRVLTVMLADEY